MAQSNLFFVKTYNLEAHQLKNKKNSDIALVPQPSDDVNDPLNWPKYKKALAFLSIITFTFSLGWMLAGIAYGIPGIIQDLSISLNQAVDGLISWVVLTLGLAVLSLFFRLFACIFSNLLELLLDSCRSMHRKTPRLHYCVIGHVRHVDLVR